MEENQQVVFWGLSCNAKGNPDPRIFQTVDLESGPWSSERCACSDFLIASLFLQAVWGGLDYLGCSYADAAVVRRVKRTWPLVAKMRDFAAFAKAGQTVCVFPEKKSVLIHIGARTEESYRRIESTLGIPFDEI